MGQIPPQSFICNDYSVMESTSILSSQQQNQGPGFINDKQEKFLNYSAEYPFNCPTYCSSSQEQQSPQQQLYSQDSVYNTSQEDNLIFSQQNANILIGQDSNFCDVSLQCANSQQNHEFSQESAYYSQQQNNYSQDFHWNLSTYEKSYIKNCTGYYHDIVQKSTEINFTKQEYLISTKENIDKYCDDSIYQDDMEQLNKIIKNPITNNSFFNYIDQFAEIQQISIENFKAYIKENFSIQDKKDIILKLYSLKYELEKIYLENNDVDIKISNQVSSTSKDSKRRRENQKATRVRKCNRNIFKSCFNVKFSIETGVRMDRQNVKYRMIRKNNKLKIEQYCSLIEKLVYNFENGHYNSPRDLYYQNARLFKNPILIGHLLNDICCTVGVTRIDLFLVASNKGFVFGDLSFSYQDKMFHCGSIKSSTLIPNCIKNVKIHQSKARFILLVEKFTTFAHLISNDIYKKFPVIMITGCGYPDLKTRHFVQKLWLELKLPVFALVDGDAYGIDIALSYKYGSLRSAYQNHHLVVPKIQWLGINADDIIEFKLQGTRFITDELKKFDSLLKRLDIQNNYEWHEQIIKMKTLGIKVELQAILDYSQEFLLECYLPYKLFYGKWM